MSRAIDQTAVTLAERILNLLDEGTFTATYKYAVLLGLIDLCMERTDKGFKAPESVTTRQLAEKVLELYWPHSLPYQVVRPGKVLRQNTKGQAKILSDIKRFRDGLPDPSMTLSSARYAAAHNMERLILAIERVLIGMPLPRVQVMGEREERFIYQIAWDRNSVATLRSAIARYQGGSGGEFDNVIRFMPGVAENLIILNGLLRPFLYREWARMVASINALEESRLEDFLFGERRRVLLAARPGLQDLQEDRCFYCSARLGRTAEVDHFVPWARYPDNGIYNLVLADERCNRYKRDFLASYEHLTNWCQRNAPGSKTHGKLAKIAAETQLEDDIEKTVGVARSIYYHLPARTMLWIHGKEFAENRPDQIRVALSTLETIA